MTVVVGITAIEASSYNQQLGQLTGLDGSFKDNSAAMSTNTAELHKHPSSPYAWYKPPDKIVPVSRPPAFAI